MRKPPLVMCFESRDELYGTLEYPSTFSQPLERSFELNDLPCINENLERTFQDKTFRLNNLFQCSFQLQICHYERYVNFISLEISALFLDPKYLVLPTLWIKLYRLSRFSVFHSVTVTLWRSSSDDIFLIFFCWLNSNDIFLVW